MINKDMRNFNLLIINANGGVRPRNRKEWNHVKATLKPKQKRMRKGPKIQNEVHLLQVEKRYDKAIADGNDDAVDLLFEMVQRRLPKRWSDAMFLDDTWERVWDSIKEFYTLKEEKDAVSE